jgi:GAF domain-containing protein
VGPSPLEDDFSSRTLASGQSAASVQLLHEIAAVVQTIVPETHVGISVGDGTGTYTTVVGTDPLVFMLDEIQYELDEGPCLTAMNEQHTVVVEDAESESRWPTFIARAVDLGMRSHLGVPLALAGTTVGGLNLYGTTRQHVDTDQLTRARMLAVLAARAIGQAEREESLRSALQSRRTVAIAIGLLMERFDLDDEEALAHLNRLSQRSGLELSEIVEHLVKQSNDLRQWTRGRHHGSAAEVTARRTVPRRLSNAPHGNE